MLVGIQVWDVSKLMEGGAAGAEEGKTPKLRAIAAVAAHDKDINALAVSPNDAFICTASQDRTAKAKLLFPLPALCLLRWQIGCPILPP